MTRIRRGGYEFVTWVGDHPPRHVHVLKNGEFVARWDLELRKSMDVPVNRKVAHLIDELVSEGRL